jgi:hypothetical protein
MMFQVKQLCLQQATGATHLALELSLLLLPRVKLLLLRL